MVRQLVLTTCKQPGHAPRWDQGWGHGLSRPRAPGEPWWYCQPAWLAPHSNFKYTARVLRVGKHWALVVGWVTKRWPLGTEEPHVPGAGARAGYMVGEAAVHGSGVADGTAGQ